MEKVVLEINAVTNGYVVTVAFPNEQMVVNYVANNVEEAKKIIGEHILKFLTDTDKNQRVRTIKAKAPKVTEIDES